MDIRNTEPFKGFLSFYESEGTIQSYSEDFRWLMECLKVRKKRVLNADSEDMRAYVLYLKERGLSDRSIRRRMASVSTLYKWLGSEERINKDPTLVFKKFKLAKIKPTFKAPTAEERNKLMESLVWDDAHYYQSLGCLLGYHGGLRIHEMAKLKPADIDWDNNVIVVLGKGQKERKVPMSSLLAEKLKPFGGFLIKKTSLAYLIKKKFNELGIHGSPHSLRHGCATMLIEDGNELLTVGNILGHSSVETTKNYVRIAEERKQASIKKTFG